MTFKDTLISLPQHLLPHHGLSQLMSKLTHSENPSIKNLLIQQVIKLYGVNMSEALQEDASVFKSFNDFFTRELKPEARPLAHDIGGIVSPADGVISQAGNIDGDTLFQAKGKTFTATDLLGGDPQRAAAFRDGTFATIYLSPKDYHRMHMPIAGKLTEMVHVPGRLFSVNAATTRSVNNLFARNERVVAIFDTELGPMALVLVGAIFVSSIETVWHGVVTPPSSNTVRTWQYSEDNIQLEKGQELGRFNMGSTIIALFGANRLQLLEGLTSGSAVKLGELIARKI
ncbi:archaetidylserine decarboxylase [Methylosoma difficile]